MQFYRASAWLVPEQAQAEAPQRPWPAAHGPAPAGGVDHPVNAEGPAELRRAFCVHGVVNAAGWRRAMGGGPWALGRLGLSLFRHKPGRCPVELHKAPSPPGRTRHRSSELLARWAAVQGPNRPRHDRLAGVG